MSAALAVKRAIDRVNEVAGWISQWFVIATIMVGLINTVLRYIGSATGRQLTSNTWVEAQWNLYSMIFLLGFGYIMKHGVNVRVDFWFTNQTSPPQAQDRSCRSRHLFDPVHPDGDLDFDPSGSNHMAPG